MVKIHIDFEVRAPVSIQDVGTDRFSRVGEILCLGYKIHGLRRIWAPPRLAAAAGLDCRERPDGLLQAIEKGAELHAWNVSFERSIWQEICVKKLNWPKVDFFSWRCTMARAAAVGLPQNLGNCADLLGTDSRKDEAGKKIMLKLTSPINRGFTDPDQLTLFDEDDLRYCENPEDLRALFDYCLDDVDAEAEIAGRLPKLKPRDLRTWFLDQTINDRGIAIDRELCEAAIDVVSADAESKGVSIFDVTKGAVQKPTQNQALLRWVNSRGFSMADMRAETVEAAIASPRFDVDPELSDVREALEIRLDGAKSSVGKFQAILDRAGDDDRLRYALRAWGAFTGRWAGQGAQPHNFPRGEKQHLRHYDSLVELFRERRSDSIRFIHGDLTSAAKSITRAAFRASPGRRLFVWDFSAIEGMTLPWLAGDENGLRPYLTGRDPYRAIAERIFQIPYDQIGADSFERAVGKIAILGLGYQMGVTTFHKQLLKAGVEATEDFAKKVVDTFRSTFPKIVSFWYALERSAIAAVRNPGEVVRVTGTGDRVAFCYIDDGKLDALRCKLPSGRLIYYFRPKLHRSTDWNGRPTDKLSFTKTEKGSSRPESTYSGKLAENVTQATARDVMVDGMFRLEANCFDLVMTVHDEMLADVEDRPELTLERGSELLCKSEPWSDGLPIAVGGFECVHYRKG